MTTAAGLSWDETLSALLGLLGSPVSLTLIDGRSGAIVASMRGTLQAGTDLSDAEDGGQLFFHFAHDHESGVVLTRSAFKGAGLMDDGSLAVELGALGLIVTREP
jgi:hypothetical protein